MAETTLLRNYACECLIRPTVLPIALVVSAAVGGLKAEENEVASIYGKQNLVAWCIVPFDAGKRGPWERAEMLKKLGIMKIAYDWRQEHVASFEDEIRALQAHGIEFLAFWDEHEEMFRLFEKYKITPQVWKMMPPPKGDTQQERVESAAKGMLPLVDRTRQLGCRLGIYNHGGWTGEPANMAAVCRWLREHTGADHVGIVYNFHHGHEHIDRFAQHLKIMQPYLLCININGMNDGAQPKILALGNGQHEVAMLQVVRDSGYQGPIGILDHRSDLDAEQSLSENLAGMKRVLTQIGDDAALKTYE